MTVLRCYCPVLALLLAHSYTAPHLAKSSLAAFIIISTLQLFFGTGIASFYGIWIHLQICSRIRSLFHVEIPSFVFLYAKSELAIEKEVDHCRAGSNHGGYGWNALFLRRSHRCWSICRPVCLSLCVSSIFPSVLPSVCPSVSLIQAGAAE